MLIVVLGLVTLLTFRTDRKGPEMEAERKTALALAQAKEALLGYAAADINHPGSLPCPDANDDGLSDAKDYTGSACVAYVGRLPWKYLGLADIRDGSGERLWYALSPSFDANTTKINPQMLGQITLRAASGAILYDASSGNGVVAVVIAPATALTRADSVLSQDRTCTVGTNCDINLICTNKPYTDAPKCLPVNYLDINPSVEDNGDFNVSTTNGFIQGTIKTSFGSTILNDRILPITWKELFSVVTMRMAHELANYWASLPGNYFPAAATNSISTVSVPLIWSSNKWDTSATVTVSGSTAAIFTMRFINCSANYSISIDNAYRVTRIGQC